MRSRRRLCYTAVPSVFFWSKPDTPAALGRRARAARRLVGTDGSVACRDSANDTNVLYDSSVDALLPTLQTAETTAVDRELHAFDEDVEETTSTDNTSMDVATQIEIVATSSTCSQTDTLLAFNSVPFLSITNLEGDPELLHYYTGLETTEKLMTVFASLGPAVNHLVYFCTQTVTGITPLNQFILMLAKLRQDLD